MANTRRLRNSSRTRLGGGEGRPYAQVMNSLDPLDPHRLRSVSAQLAALRAALDEAEREHAPEIESVPARYRPGARNLVHYVALRGFDLRALQEQLADMGLSSLGRCEARVLDALDDVCRVVTRLLGEAAEGPTTCTRKSARESLHAHAQALLGSAEPGAIMVTLPSEAAHDRALVRLLVAAGMTIARVNCAHDDEPTWRAMVEHVREAERELGQRCRVMFDLPGPKLRTLAVSEPGFLRLGVNDLLLLTGDGRPGAPARLDDRGQVREPARIACGEPRLISALRIGAPIYFDDGKLAGKVEALHASSAEVRITYAAKAAVKLRADKGINVPETELDVPALGPDDHAALAVALSCAELVGLSFARSREDVQSLQRVLAQHRSELAIVLKIETERGFSQLPSLLLTALCTPPVGVMIARGDLAVECGFERLAELQEEILWLAEAAHVPSIWATQVLETLTKKGRLTRAEITDAAMAERAECVMLNKGPHVVRAVRTLRDVITRMRGHQHKKTALLRPLTSVRFEG